MRVRRSRARGSDAAGLGRRELKKRRAAKKCGCLLQRRNRNPAVFRGFSRLSTGAGLSLHVRLSECFVAEIYSVVS